MSRQEPTDACYTVLARMYAEQGGRQRWAGLTEVATAHADDAGMQNS